MSDGGRHEESMVLWDDQKSTVRLLEVVVRNGAVKRAEEYLRKADEELASIGEVVPEILEAIQALKEHGYGH